MRRSSQVVVSLMLLTVFGIAPVSAADSVIGSPDITTSASDNRVLPGTTTGLDVALVNDGNLEQGGPPQHEQRVETARATRVALRAGDAPVEVRTDPIAVGTVPPGRHGPVTFRLAIDEDASPGRYRLPVEITHDYTRHVEYGPRQAPEYHDLTRTVHRTVTVVVEDRARFAVVGTRSDVVAGGRGTAEVGLRNVGEEAATDAEVTVTASDPALRFVGGGLTATTVEHWPAGATRRISVTAAAANDTGDRRLTARASVTYDDASGTPREAPPVTVGVPVGGGQRFVVANVSSSLRVDRDGSVSGTVTNDGPLDVDAATLLVSSAEPDLVPLQRTAALGAMDAGDTATFDLGYAVRSDAQPGPRQLPLAVAYHRGDDRFVSEVTDPSVPVAPARDRFDVEAVTNSIAAGGYGRLEVRVTNAMEETVTDVRPRIFTKDPLSSDDDKAYVEELAPNESATVSFALGVDGSAIEKSYPVALDVVYGESGSGDDAMSSTYRVPVDVGDAGLPPGVLAVVAALLGVGAVVGFRRFER